MSISKVSSVIVSSDGTNSTIVITAPGNDFIKDAFVTISNCDVPVLNGTFRITTVIDDMFSFQLPLAYLATPTSTEMFVESLAELSISPKIFSDNQIDLSYMYGISDFWSAIFEGTDKIDLLLESFTLQSSDVYNRFLQLTTTISLSEIQAATNSQLKLVVLDSSSLVPGTEATYYLPEKILGCSFIMNRPFLPSLTLEDGTHYSINEKGTEISLFDKIEALNFPVRKSITTGYNEFSLWMTDVKLDDQLISKYYAKLIGVNPQTSTEKFKNYVYGLFYLYTHGPNLSQLRKGLNLTLGLPLARDYETVLDVRQYLETNQYVVITDFNQYLIPYGIAPTVVAGDYLIPSQEIAQWVELKDWTSDGRWWINLYIPNQILPYVPSEQVDRYAKDGTYADQLMSSYLKNHTFLVNVNVTNFKDIQNFQELYDILYNVKPTHTFPVYIWSVPVDEFIPIVDNLDNIQYYSESCENLSVPISRMKRGLTDPNLYLKRGCPQFVRFNVSNYISEITGGSTLINGDRRPFNLGLVTGYINYREQFEGINQSSEDKAWVRALFTRGERTQRWKKSFIKFDPSTTYSDNSGISISGFPSVPASLRVIPLYITTKADLQIKFDLLGMSKVDSNVWTYEILKPTNIQVYINQKAVNDGRGGDYSEIIKSNFNLLFSRSSVTNKPGNFIPKKAFDYHYTTAVANDIRPYDYLIVSKIYEDTYGVYWVTNNSEVDALPYQVVFESDGLSISITGSKIGRGMGPMGTPFYFLRGAGITTTYGAPAALDTTPINERIGGTVDVVSRYSDTLNTIQVMGRNGNIIDMRKDLL